MANHVGTLLDEEQQLAARRIALMGAASGEIVGGGGAVVLAIIALAGILPTTLLAVAGLAVGAALMFEGGAIASRYRDIAAELDSRFDLTALGGGLSAEFLGGAAGVVLALITLLGLNTAMLMAISAIVYGGALVIGAETAAELRSLTVPRSEKHEHLQKIAHSALSATVSTRVMGGLGAVVLGILALIDAPSSVTLSLVAFLAIGGTILLSGTAIGGKVLAIFRH